MEVVEVLIRLGGVADTRRLVAHTSRRRVARAVEQGQVVRDARGRYALPTADQARRAANRLDGVVSGPSAAAAHGWELKTPPELPVVTIPAKRRVPEARRAGVQVRWRDVEPGEEWGGVLTAGATVVDCAKHLPFDEALAVADSALRHGDVTSTQLHRLADRVATTGRARCRRVAREATGLAANPFESVLRAVCLDVPGLSLQPQVVIDEDGWTGRPDLVDVDLRLVVEADSFEFHGHRRALVRDCERYNALTLRGWTVLRFPYEHVMGDPGYVRDCLQRAVGQETPAPGRRTGTWRRESPVRRTAVG